MYKLNRRRYYVRGAERLLRASGTSAVRLHQHIPALRADVGSAAGDGRCGIHAVGRAHLVGGVGIRINDSIEVRGGGGVLLERRGLR